MKFLKLSSAFIVLLTWSTCVLGGNGSSSWIVKDTVQKGQSGFSGSFEKGLYKSVLDISKHHLSGFIFLKKSSDSTYRILFSNQIGMKFFDFEIGENHFTVHYCFPSLDKKALLKLLRMDFQVLLFPFSGIKEIEPVDATIDSTDFKIKSFHGKWNYRIINSTGRIIRMDSKGKIVGKTRIGVGYKADLPNRMEILNPTIRLTLKMELIN